MVKALRIFLVGLIVNGVALLFAPAAAWAQVWVGYPDVQEFFSQYETIDVGVDVSWDTTDPATCAPADSAYINITAYQDDYWSYGDQDWGWVPYGTYSNTFYDGYSSSYMSTITYDVYASVTYSDEWGGYQRQNSAQAPVIPMHCSNDAQRSALKQEYITYQVSLNPSCADFSSSRHSSHFSFSELNSGWYSYALVHDALIAPASSYYGLDYWRDLWGSSRIVNSGFRNPAHNNAIGGAAQSQHMYGTAADIRNESAPGWSEWDIMWALAHDANADYVEPWNGPCSVNCVHADWRSHSGGYQ